MKFKSLAEAEAWYNDKIASQESALSFKAAIEQVLYSARGSATSVTEVLDIINETLDWARSVLGPGLRIVPQPIPEIEVSAEVQGPYIDRTWNTGEKGEIIHQTRVENPDYGFPEEKVTPIQTPSPLSGEECAQITNTLLLNREFWTLFKSKVIASPFHGDEIANRELAFRLLQGFQTPQSTSVSKKGSGRPSGRGHQGVRKAASQANRSGYALRKQRNKPQAATRKGKA
jgi:hypothetical protein